MYTYKNSRTRRLERNSGGGGNNYYLCMYSSMCVYMCVCGLVLILDSETAPTLRKSTLQRIPLSLFLEQGTTHSILFSYFVSRAIAVRGSEVVVIKPSVF